MLLVGLSPEELNAITDEQLFGAIDVILEQYSSLGVAELQRFVIAEHMTLEVLARVHNYIVELKKCGTLCITSKHVAIGFVVLGLKKMPSTRPHKTRAFQWQHLRRLSDQLATAHMSGLRTCGSVWAQPEGPSSTCSKLGSTRSTGITAVGER